MGTVIRKERRDTSTLGDLNRARFAASVHLLRALGLSVRATEYFKHCARGKRQLPHELLAELVEATLFDVKRGADELVTFALGTKSGGL